MVNYTKRGLVMYAIGDLIVYGSTGVCRVTDITTPSFAADSGRLYYALEPLYQRGVIYTPVDTKVFMRTVITPEDVQKLIAQMPQVEEQGYYASSVQNLSAYYEEALKQYHCIDLVRLTKSIDRKRNELERQNRKLGQIDLRFLKKAEELLHGELAAALEMDPQDVREYLAARV